MDSLHGAQAAGRGAEPDRVWFTLFEAGAGGPIAAKTTIPDPVAGERDWIRIGGAPGIGAGRAFGWAGRRGGSWPSSRRAAALPPPDPLMYRSKVPKTKLAALLPARDSAAALGVGDRQISLDGWRGMVGHNWGSEHAERWIWLHGARLRATTGLARRRDRRGRAWVEDDSVGRNGAVEPRGRAALARRARAGAYARCARSPGSASSAARRAGSWFRDVSAALEDCVGWVYADPAGGEHHSINCSVADMRLRVERQERPVLALESAAAPPTSWACARPTTA